MHAPGLTSDTSPLIARRDCARRVIAPLTAFVAFAAALGSHAPAHAESAVNGIAAQGREESGYIEAYLSDQRRVGSLAGGILGGALIAHPAGTVVGSLLGFVLGSQAMEESNGDAVAREGPASGTLALASQNDFGSRPGPGSLGHEAERARTMPIHSPSPLGPVPVAPSPTHPVAPLSREQIMQVCALGPPADPRLRAMCYYFQGR